MIIDSQRTNCTGTFDFARAEWKKPPSQKFVVQNHPSRVFHFTQIGTKLQNPNKTRKRENTTGITKTVSLARIYDKKSEMFCKSPSRLVFSFNLGFRGVFVILFVYRFRDVVNNAITAGDVKRDQFEKMHLRG